MIIFSVGLVVLLRLHCLRIALENEEKSVANDTEYGIQNTKLLSATHIVFYLSCLCETLIRHPSFDWISGLGFAMLFFAMVLLGWIVRILGDNWTVRQLFVERYRFTDHWLLQRMKQSNVILIIIPELVGLALLCHAKYSFLFLFPVYMGIFYKQTRQENVFFKETVASSRQ